MNTQTNIELNHLIIFATNKNESARFLTSLLGLPDPQPDGFFATVEFANDVTLLYAEPGIDFSPQHYAFLTANDAFDEILSRIKERNIDIWADPQRKKPGELYDRDGERGFYFLDPAGHGMEILTRSGKG